jgi:hypothetical protein
MGAVSPRIGLIADRIVASGRIEINAGRLGLLKNSKSCAKGVITAKSGAITAKTGTGNAALFRVPVPAFASARLYQQRRIALFPAVR